MAKKKIPIGRTLRTQDKFLPIAPGKQQELKGKRWVAVIETNSNQECAVVRMTTKETKNTSEIKGYNKGNKKKTFYKHFVEVVDNEGKPIKVDGVKFVENQVVYDLTSAQVERIRDNVLGKVIQSPENRKKIRKLKKRK